MKIYTRTGDKGRTGLIGGSRVAKSDARVGAYGEVDELNCALGAARAALGPELKTLDSSLERVQAECFEIGALLATPADKLKKLAASFAAALSVDAAPRLEGEIDAWDKELEPLQTFILPGGGSAGAALHLARAVCRRAERRAVELAAEEPLPEGVIVYLNRLSDWLFTAARWVNRRAGRAETPWAGRP